MKTETSMMPKLALLTLVLPWTAGAAPSPNYYECQSRNASVNLTVGGSGEVGIAPAATLLQIRIGKESFSFGDRDILTEQTSIGALWSATLEQVPDLYVKHAAVIIPEIALGSKPVSFDSQLILTTTQTPLFPDAFEGPVQSSRYLDLSCSASLLYF